MKIGILLLSVFTMLSCSGCEGEDPAPETPVIDTSLDKREIQETGAYQLFYKPSGGITGDPMPYYNSQDKKFEVFFLTSNASTSGIHVAGTTDFGSFEQMSSSILVGSAGSYDTGIGTGSCVKNGNQYTFFYTGFSNQTPSSVVLKATSGDLRNWIKSPSFRIEAPAGFEQGEFRDPCVYFDETRGKYVMLVGSRMGGKAAVARFESADLNDWQVIEPLVGTTSETPQSYEIETDSWIPECPDIFKAGDKWYLVFSRLNRDMHRKTFYRVADNPNGPWRIFRDENGKHETFDGLYLYAAKSVSDGTNRYISGWASTGQNFNSIGELDWGGCLVTHKLVQQPDGKLYPQIVDAVDAKFLKPVDYKDLLQDGIVSGSKGDFTLSAGKVVFNRNIASVKIEMTIDATNSTKNFGIAFGAYENQQDTYDLKFDLTSDNAYGIPALFLSHAGKDHNFTPLVVPQDRIFNVKIILEKTLCVMYVNDNVAFSNRISNMNQNPWMIFADQGTVRFENIKIYRQ